MGNPGRNFPGWTLPPQSKVITVPKTVEELEKLIAEKDGRIAALEQENKTATESVAHAVAESAALKDRVALFEKEKRNNIVARYKAIPCYNAVPETDIEKLENAILEARIFGYESAQAEIDAAKKKAAATPATGVNHAAGAPAVPQGNATPAKPKRPDL